LVILAVVVSVVAAGAGVTDSFTTDDASRVDVQVGPRFSIPSADDLNRTAFPTNPPGRQVTFVTDDGGRLNVVRETLRSDSLTMTVPVRNRGDGSGVVRLTPTVQSSSTQFELSVVPISESLAENSSFVRVTDHVVGSEGTVFVELPPETAVDGVPAVNVTLNFGERPETPLDVAVGLSPVDGSASVGGGSVVSPTTQNESDGGEGTDAESDRGRNTNGNKNGSATNDDGTDENGDEDDGESSENGSDGTRNKDDGSGKDENEENASARVEAQTVVFEQKNEDALRSFDPADGETVEYGDGLVAKALGPQANLAGDLRTEVPFVGDDQRLRTVNASDRPRTLLTKETNGDVDLNQDVRLGVADVDGDGHLSVLLSDNDDRLRRYEPATDQLVTLVGGGDEFSPHSVAGVVEDGTETGLFFTDSDGRLLRLDLGNRDANRSENENGNRNETTTVEIVGVTVESPVEVGSPFVDTDGVARVPVVLEDETVVLVDTNGTTTALTDRGQPTGSLATVDIDDDGAHEVVFTDGASDNRLVVVELDGSTRGFPTDANRTEGNTGVA
jgi:hypothetical protein